MQDCRVETDAADLAAFIDIPEAARGIVVFAHGSGSGRFSSRNQFVAKALGEAGLATLLLDLLTPKEDAYDRRTAELRFDINLLAGRVEAAVDWCRKNAATQNLPVGLFGASTGAAAALVAAAHHPDAVAAIVSRGGRPDLAGLALREVRAPTLLIVGGNDNQVLELNRAAAAQLAAKNEIIVIPGAGHLFEERGTLERVAELARDWFVRYLSSNV
jgi:putative phosphoribosyl transferase